MASSQVEIASSSHFGYISRDRNRRDRFSNATRVSLPRNLEEFVRGHLSSFDENQSLNKKMNVVDSWGSTNDQPAAANNRRLVINNNNQDEDCESSLINPRHARVLDRWAVARRVPQMISATSLREQGSEMDKPQSSSVAQSEPSSNPTNRGASSLVQIWEARMKRTNSAENLNANSRTSSNTLSYNGNENEIENEMIFSFSVEEASRRESEIGDLCDNISRTSNLQDSLSITDWESASDITRAISELPSSSQGRNLDEREKVHVADIIRRLISENQQRRELSSESSKEQCRPSSSAASDISEHSRVLTKAVITPKIRGRQAFADLLMRMQGDRRKELDSLATHQTVSKFAQKGRIQSMLRVRCPQRCAAIQDKYRSKSSAQIKQKPHPQGLAVMHLRERFNICQSDDTSLRTPIKETVNNSARVDNSSSHNQLSGNSRHPVESTAILQNTPPVECSVVQPSEEPRKESSLSSIFIRPRISGKNHEEASSSSYSKKPPRSKVLKKEVCSRSNVTEKQKIEAPEKEVDTTSKVSSPRISEKLEKEPRVSSNDTQREELRSENNHPLSQDNEETVASLNALDETESKNEGSCLEQPLSTVAEEREEPSASLINLEENENAVEENTNEHQDIDPNTQENLESVASYANWDDNEMEEEGQDFDDQQFYLESGYDWFSEISRPRSYWEDLRKSWYQEVLNTRSEDEEIRKLLERRTVSSFLCSDLRDRMDQLMISHVQQQTYLEECQDEDENEESGEERIRHLMSFLQQNLNPTDTTNQPEEEQVLQEEVEQVVERNVQELAVDDRGEEDEEEEDEEMFDGEEGSLISRQFQEAASSDYFDQSWGYRESDSADESDRVASASRSQTLPSPSFQECHQFSSSNNQPSVEIEIIYNMRGHMEQLQREMSELRKCMMSCMEMQSKMQQAIMQKLHSGQSARNSSLNNALPRRNCVVCYEMQVDSLLYRCGHMCTCLKCAHELQWSTGKCPICRAPIVDVVRAFIDS